MHEGIATDALHLSALPFRPVVRHTRNAKLIRFYWCVHKCLSTDAKLRLKCHSALGPVLQSASGHNRPVGNVRQLSRSEDRRASRNLPFTQLVRSGSFPPEPGVSQGPGDQKR